MPKAIVTLPPADYLRQCFDYDPSTGILRWRERPPEHFKNSRAWIAWNAKHFGKPVGWASQRGYLYTQVHRHKFLVSRIIWKMVYGADPIEIDHIDRNSRNNRLDNLRNATRIQNGQNKIKPVGRCGFTGVAMTDNGKYRAHIKDGPKMRHLGVFDTAEAAHVAYRDAAKAAFGEFDPFRLQNFPLVQDKGSS